MHLNYIKNNECTPETEPALPTTTAKTGLHPGWWLIFLILFGLLYGVQGNTQETAFLGRSAILWMIRRLSGTGGDFSHGWLIPLVSAYVVWKKRKEIGAAPRRIHYGGLVLLLLSLFLHWIGTRAQLTRLSLLSMIMLLWAIPLYLYGLAVARHLVFPCAYLIYCIPLSFLDHITLPLRIVASSMSAFLLNGLGIETMRRGTGIYTMAAGGFNMEVADPCSGLRSLLAMTALTAVFAYFTQRTTGSKVLLFLTAVPVAMLGNVVRIVTTGVVAQWFGRAAALRMYHDYSGFVVFAVSFMFIVGAGYVIRRFTVGKHGQ